MTKTKRTETVEEYDEKGRMVRKTVTEETVEDDVPTMTTWLTQPADWSTSPPYTNTTTSTTSCELQGQISMDELQRESAKANA